MANPNLKREAFMNLNLADIRADITENVERALREDIGSGDITADLIAAHTQVVARVITREPCTVCGLPWVDEVFAQLGKVRLDWRVADGDSVAADTVLVELKGDARAILTGERTALNFLQLLSGTATIARKYSLIAKQHATAAQAQELKILDTRKTLPGLRLAQKYAVVVGGCHNHRLGLYDAFLIKENHIAACGGVSQAIGRARALHPEKPIIVEVETYQEYCQAIQHPVTRIMLDALSESDLKKVFDKPTTIPLETSGNVDANTLKDIVNTPVQAVSSGALTKHVRAIDLSLRIIS